MRAAQARPVLLRLHATRASGEGGVRSTMSKPRNTDVKEAASTRWLRLNTITYRDSQDMERFWDSCERATRKPEASADAVVIFAVLRRSGTPPETLLVKQYRPPMAAPTLELPAGLIDPGESAAEAALRELREETGYSASVRSISPAACMSPGLTNETVHLVHVDVDLDAPENATPRQASEDEQDIQVLRVPLAQLEAHMVAQVAAGVSVYHGLWALVLGMNMTMMTAAAATAKK